MLPLLDLNRQYREIRTEVEAAIARVLQSGRFVGGPEVEGFNQEFGAYCGGHCVGVGNGTDALYLILRALGVGTGHEVIVPALTFMATAEAVTLTGARIVWADVDRESLTLDPSDVAKRITSRTRAIIAVHLHGRTAAMEPLGELARRHGLLLIEDAAQAHGAVVGGKRVGVLARAAAFSFYPGKNLGAYGDAGAVVSSDAALIARIARLADHGRVERHLHMEEGLNSRLDALQAAVLRCKLRFLDGWTERRRTLAQYYLEGLAGLEELELPVPLPQRDHVYHLFVVRLEQRDALRDYLLRQGIQTGLHYPLPLHKQPAYQNQAAEQCSLPESEAAGRRVLSLPLFPELTVREIRTVVRHIENFLVRSEKGLLTC